MLEVGIVPQVPTASALPHTWTLKWVHKELGIATLTPSSAGSRDRAPSSNSFRIATYLDLQVGLRGTWELDNGGLARDDQYLRQSC